jgi:diguanylate cyclase (GGDEF)-like protein
VLPFDAPTDPLGDAGWAVAGAILAAFPLIAVILRRGRWVTWNMLLGVSYLGLGLIVALGWLAGGNVPPYSALILIPVIYTAAIHPPRQVLTFLVAVVAAGLVPLELHGFSSAAKADLAASLVIWIGAGMLALLLMERVRSQRIGLQTAGDEARQQARSDPLTGLGNRRAFDEMMDAEIARVRRTGMPLSLVVVDIDGFKEINDRYGHLEGDRCLREVASVLAGSSRRPDACFRWGGDEFTMLAVGTDEEGARQAGERLSAAVVRTARRPDGTPITIRFGTSQLDGGMDADDLLDRADIALLSSRPSRADADLTD